jgi:solute carrier family 25 protein 39/40
MSSGSPTISPHTPGQRHDRSINRAGDDAIRFRKSTPISDNANANTEISIMAKMMCAVSGSLVTSLIITPLDVVRVRLQTQPSPSSITTARLPSFIQLPPNLGVSSCCREVFWVQNQSQFCVAAPGGSSHAAAVFDEAIISDCAAEQTQRRTYNSTFDGLRKIARNEGVSTLWRGLSPTLLMAVPSNVIYFAGYDWLRDSASSPISAMCDDNTAPLLAGSIARVFSAGAVGPLDMLRTRMQASSSTDKGNSGIMRATIQGLRDMVAEQGYTSLWRGLSLTLWRDVPFSALYWWGYEFGRTRLNESRARSPSHRHGEPLSHSALLTDSFIAGAASGAISALVTTPFDVGKTRRQTIESKGLSSAQLRALPEGQAMPRFLWHIYSTEGTSGLFKGWVARVLRVAPACAIMISSYEIGKRMARQQVDVRDEQTL